MTARPYQIIHIQAAAPLKPPEGSACNGCGVCCLTAPCPLGMVLTGRRSGACSAIRWDEVTQVYRCGAISEAQDVLRERLPRLIHGVTPLLAPWLGRAARRWVSAGSGCDSSLEVGSATTADGTMAHD